MEWVVVGWRCDERAERMRVANVVGPYVRVWVQVGVCLCSVVGVVIVVANVGKCWPAQAMGVGACRCRCGCRVACSQQSC